MTAITQETLSVSGIMLAKLFNRQHQELSHFHAHNQELSELVVRQQMIGHSFFSVVMTFMSISPAFIYLLAGYLISGTGPSAISAGTVIAFTTLQARLYFPIGRLLEVSVELQSSMALFERIFGYLDLKQEIVDAANPISLKPDQVMGGVKFDRVRLNYGLTAVERLEAKLGETTSIKLNGDSRQRWALDGVSWKSSRASYRPWWVQAAQARPASPILFPASMTLPRVRCASTVMTFETSTYHHCRT